MQAALRDLDNFDCEFCIWWDERPYLPITDLEGNRLLLTAIFKPEMWENWKHYNEPRNNAGPHF